MRSKPGYQTHTGKMIQAGKETSLSSQDTICPALVNCVCAGRGVTSSKTSFQETCGGLESGGATVPIRGLVYLEAQVCQPARISTSCAVGEGYGANPRSVQGKPVLLPKRSH